MSNKFTIVIVDDEVAIADLLAEIFSSEGFTTYAFYDSQKASEFINEKHSSVDLILSDIMMPNIDGYELCRQARQITDAPFLFLTAKDAETDVIVGLSIGADDYIVKPFRPREIVARVKAHLRRSQTRRLEANSAQTATNEAQSEQSLVFNGLELNPKTHEATLLDIPLVLTPKEFKILEILMRNPASPVSSQSLYEEVWEEEANYSSSNTIMVHIRHLRKKLAEIDSSVEYIKTVWGVGYKLGI